MFDPKTLNGATYEEWLETDQSLPPPEGGIQFGPRRVIQRYNSAKAAWEQIGFEVWRNQQWESENWIDLT